MPGGDLRALWAGCLESSHAYAERLEPSAPPTKAGHSLPPFLTFLPTCRRRPLPPLVAPVLLDHLQRVLAQLQAGFPAAAACLRSGFGGGRNPAAGFGALADDVLDGDASSSATGTFSWACGASLGVQRPRLLVCGPEGTGQAHLGPAILYALEGLPVHAIGLPSLLSDAGARAPEEALVHAVVEARRAAPAVLFLPHLQASFVPLQEHCKPAVGSTWIHMPPCHWAVWSIQPPPCLHCPCLYGPCSTALLKLLQLMTLSHAPFCTLPGVVGHGPQLAASHAVDAAGRSSC